jgi:hypothetical protein
VAFFLDLVASPAPRSVDPAFTALNRDALTKYWKYWVDIAKNQAAI